MKIALLGNMNNLQFVIYRYLKDDGFDVTLFLLPQETIIFSPEYDSFEHSNIDFQILNWNYDNLITYPKSKIQAILNQYDFIIGQGIAMAYCAKAGRNLDLMIPYGGDIRRLPYFKKIRVDNNLRRNIKRWVLAYYQRKGIRKAANILMDETNDFYENELKRFKPEGKRYKVGAPMFYNKQYNNYAEKYKDKSIYYKKFKSIREQFQFIVFQHARQMWKDIPDSTNSNGNNFLIKGFASFVKTSNVKSVLILFESGNDVENSKLLIKDLGIEHFVIWIPFIPRKEIMMVINIADLVVGELYNSYLSYGTIYEAMAMGKPVMHKRTDALYTSLYSELYPMLYADSAESIYHNLLWCTSHMNDLKQMGYKANEWTNRYAIDIPLNKIKKIIYENSGNS